MWRTLIRKEICNPKKNRINNLIKEAECSGISNSHLSQTNKEQKQLEEKKQNQLY
ncbi:MAG: hypothetical protein ACXVPU_05705 [Bacteroidia bacterium]